MRSEIITKINFRHIFRQSENHCSFEPGAQSLFAYAIDHSKTNIQQSYSAMKNRRIPRILFFVFLLGLLVIVFQFVRLPFLPVRLHEAVPASTGVMLQFADPAAIETIYEKSGNILRTATVRKDAAAFTELFPGQGEGRILAAMRGQDLELLYVTARTRGFKLKDAVQSLDTETINFQDHTVFKIVNTAPKDIYVTRFRNLLVWSHSAVLVEESVTQLYDYSGSMRGEKNFRRVERTEAEGVAAYVYLNFRNLSSAFAPYMSLKKRADINNFGNWVNWLKLGLIPTADGYEVQGAITGELKFLKYLDDLKGDALYKILPDDLAVMTRMEAPLVGKFSPEFQQYFQPWIEGEIAYVNLEPLSAGAVSDKVFVVRANDVAQAEKLLDALGATAGKLDSYDYGMFRIEQLLADDVLMPVFGKRLNPIKNPYYTVLDNFVIFCNSKRALQAWLDKILTGETLNNNVDFLQNQSGTDAEKKIYFTLNFNRLQGVLENYLPVDFREEFRKNTEAYYDLGRLSLSVFPQGQRTLFRGKLSQKAQAETPLQQQAPAAQKPAPTDSEVLWKTALPAAAATAPTLLQDPQSGKKIILLQDAKDVVHCFSESGEPLWQRNLKRPLLSDFIQPRGTNVILFNTDKEIFKIDFAGTDEIGFPMRQKPKMTTGISVFNFNRTDEFSLFVPCKNGKIYAYNADGVPLADWQQNVKTGKFIAPLQHLQAAAKDFIFGTDDAGEMHVFDRTGSPRFPDLKATRKDYVTAPAFDTDPTATRIAALDKNGRIIITNTEGETFALNPQIGTAKEPRFLMSNLLGDARKEYIFLTDKDLTVWTYVDKNFQRAFAHTFEHPQSEVFAFENHLGTVDKKRAEIWLLDANGEVQNGFPLGGTTAFRLENTGGEMRVITGCKEGLCAYRVRI